MKYKALTALLLATLIVTTGCTDSVHKQSRIAGKSEGEDKLVVYASLYPMYDFAKNIGGNKIDLRQIVPAGAQPHDWEPTAKLMVEMQRADVFIYNGLGMEPWADNLLASIDSDKLIAVEASKNISLLKLNEQDNGHSHSDYDPHVWLDPVRAQAQAKNITDALVEADPENKNYYHTNFRHFSKKLKDLDAEYKETLNKVKSRQIVVTHAAFGYLADRYDIEQIPVSGINPQEEPSAAQLVELTRLLREKNIGYVFFETLTSPKLAEVLANEVGAQTMTLNPLGGLTQQQLDEGWDYMSVMKKNLEILSEALGE